MIVHIFNTHHFSGPETLVIPALPKLGVPVTVIFIREARLGTPKQTPEEYARRLGVPVQTVIARSRFDWAAIVELGNQLKALHPTLVHSHDVKASFYTLLASFLSRGRWKRFSTHHGVGGRPHFKTKLYERFYAWIVLRFFNRVLAVSHQDYHSLRRIGLKSPQLQLHLNGITFEAQSHEQRLAKSPSIRTQWCREFSNIRPQAIQMGVIARLSPEKRHDRVLDLAQKLLANPPRNDWQILCFGVGECAAKLRQQTVKLGLDRQVLWLDFRPNLRQELAGLDLVLSLSDFEGLPINVLEAAWMHLPVLATAVGGLRDLNEGGGQAAVPLFECPPDLDEVCVHLKNWIDHTEFRNAAGDRLFERVKNNFSQDRWLRDLRKIYQLNEGDPSC